MSGREDAEHTCWAKMIDDQEATHTRPRWAIWHAHVSITCLDHMSRISWSSCYLRLTPAFWISPLQNDRFTRTLFELHPLCSIRPIHHLPQSTNSPISKRSVFFNHTLSTPALILSSKLTKSNVLRPFHLGHHNVYTTIPRTLQTKLWHVWMCFVIYYYTLY